MASHLEELESLLIDWETGTLDDEGVERVREILRSDAEARKHFAEQQMLSVALKLDEDAGLGMSASVVEAIHTSERAESSVISASQSASRVSRVSIWFAAAAAVLVCLLAGRLAYLEFGERVDGSNKLTQAEPLLPQVNPTTPRTQSKEATSRGVALVTRLIDVAWADDQQALEVGDALAPGRLAIESGFAQVEFFCGATVILQGPAELELTSETLARVHHGRLRAQVPPAARGFSIEAADIKVVDLGTEFGLAVSPEGADVQVFDGEVELHRSETEEQLLLTAGQAVVRNARGKYEELLVFPEEYVDIQQLEKRAKGQRAVRYERWKQWSQQRRSDPRLIAYYGFDDLGSGERKLKSDLDPVNRELDGAIVGARRVSGRWNSKDALEFKRPGDRVRVQIPGEYSSLTFACWVKIDSLDRWYNSLFLTDGYNQGEPHWQILDSGQIQFSVRVKSDDNQGPEHAEVLSPPFWNPSLSGKWINLATTYDVDQQRVTHYLNGKELSRETIPDFQLVKTTRIGRATIGNWSSPQRPDADFAIRNLNGRIDEFALFAAALSGEEIHDMYQYGKP